MMEETRTRRKLPTADDVRLIMAAKEEREKLKRHLHQLSNANLANKFELSIDTIHRIGSDEGYVTNVRDE